MLKPAFPKLRSILLVAFIEAATALAQKVPYHGELAPHWQAGQSWRVEYLRNVPSPVQSPSPSSRPAERTIWRYRVMQIETQQIRIEATEEGGSGNFELWFEASPLRFRRAVKIVGNRRIDAIVHSANTPYSGWSADDPLIFDWPALPSANKDSTREFTDDNGRRIRQAVRFTSPAQFEIAMTLTRTVDRGYTEERRSTQTWMFGAPWWSEAAIRTGSVIDGKRSEEVNIRGRLLP